MSSSASIKDVIETVSCILLHHGFPKISANIFRRAKFNKTDAALYLLNIIYKIVSLNLPECIECDNHLILIYVLGKLQYPRLSYLVDVVESELSSRELLLSLGFLLVKFNVFTSLRTKAEEYLYDHVVQDIKGSLATHKKQTFSAEEGLDGLIVLRKKIDLIFRRLYSSISTYEKLLKRYKEREKLILRDLNEYSMKIKFKHISLIDLLIQGNLKLQKRLVDAVCKQDILLKLHLKWIKMEPIFWKWMVSVANEAISSDDCIPAKCTRLNDKLYIPLLLSSNADFNDIFKHFCSDDENSLHDLKVVNPLLSWKQILLLSDSKGRSFDDDINHLQAEMNILKGESRLQLSKYVMENHPELVQLPLPRR